MQKIGTIQRGENIGRNKTHSYIWSACKLCGVERWVLLDKGKAQNQICRACNDGLFRLANQGKGSKCRNWKGGRYKTFGYIRVWLPEDDFFYSMTNKYGYVLEHRLVMAQSLGRCLHLWEIVHHKNHIRDDNRLENLQLVSDDKHRQLSLLENRIQYLEQRVILLEAENVLLKGGIVDETLINTGRDRCHGRSLRRLWWA